MATALTVHLTVRDESLDGRAPHEWPLAVPTARLSVRELIRSRVMQEVRDYNARRPHRWRGLVQPSADARRAAGRADPVRPPVDWQRQCELAAAAFESGRLLILVGDVQATRLDEEFDLRPGSAVTFLRLSLLVGG